MASAATTAAISLSLKADADTDMAGVRTIDFSADTTAAGTNVIDLSNGFCYRDCWLYAVTGGAGVDQITMSLGIDTINGAAGTDAITVVDENHTGCC